MEKKICNNFYNLKWNGSDSYKIKLKDHFKCRSQNIFILSNWNVLFIWIFPGKSAFFQRNIRTVYILEYLKKKFPVHFDWTNCKKHAFSGKPRNLSLPLIAQVSPLQLRTTFFCWNSTFVCLYWICKLILRRNWMGISKVPF